MFAQVQFPDFLDLRYTGIADEWEMLAPFRCTWVNGRGEKQVLEVPKGFVNDLASIPQLFQNIVPVVGPQNLPSVVHDYIYSRKGRLLPHFIFSRKQADMLFLAGLEAVGVGAAKRWAMYSAVRVGGGAAWLD